MLNPIVSTQMRSATDRREVNRTPRSSSLIVHVDMDAFFASVEERDNPSIKGKPVIIGGEPGTRGVVTTANYEAREYGVHAGMSLTEAGKRCPQGVFLRTHGKKYTWVSVQLMGLLRSFSPVVEPYSIDEAFLDGAGCDHLWGGPVKYGEAIRSAIKEHLDLTGSVGIAPSKIVAKIASGMNKPNGLTVLMPEDVVTTIGGLAVEKIPGVGKSTKKILNGIGIFTIDTLANASTERLRAALGKNGEELKKLIRGEEGNKIIALEERPEDKSMGHEHTFMEDVQSENVIAGRLLHLCDKATRRMRTENYLGNCITLRLRDTNFVTRSHQRKLPFYTDDPAMVFHIAMNLLHEIWTENDGKVRLIGVSVSGLLKPSRFQGVQVDLFNAPKVERMHRLYYALDKVRDAYGDDSLEFAAGSRTLRKRMAVQQQ